MQGRFIEIGLTAMNLSLLYMRSYCFLPLFCGFLSWRLDQFFVESTVLSSSCGAAPAAAASTTAPDANPGRQAQLLALCSIIDACLSFFLMIIDSHLELHHIDSSEPYESML